MTAVEADYSRREAKLGLGGVLFALPDVLWVNRPDLAARAVYKPLQYSVAARAGLTVPPTLVTNSASAVARFAASATGVVQKPLGTNLIFEDGQYKMGYTHLVTDADLADLGGVQTTAHHLQQWAPKVAECRAVVVGEDIFCVAIHAGSEQSYVTTARTSNPTPTRRSSSPSRYSRACEHSWPNSAWSTERSTSLSEPHARAIASRPSHVPRVEYR